MGATSEKPINNLWGYLFVGGALILLIAFAIDAPVPTEVLEAEIVGVHQRQSEEPRPPVLLAKLQNGITVRLHGSSHVLRKIGAKVLVQKYERRLFGAVHFRFISFVEQREKRKGALEQVVD